MSKGKLYPESRWKIRIENNILYSEDWNGTKQEFDLTRISRIYVRATSEGPWFPDVWIGLVGDSDTLEYPQGATGEEDFLNFTNKLEGFSWNGMNSTNNDIHPCWIKPA